MSRAVNRLAAMMRADSNEDEADALHIIDMLMREFIISDDKLTGPAMNLREALKAVAREWAQLGKDGGK